MARAARTSVVAVILSGVIALLAGTPAASAAESVSCARLGATLGQIQTALPKATSASALARAISTYGSELEAEAAGSSTAIRQAVATFVADLRAAGAGAVNVPKLTADAAAITTACAASAPALGATGAPATGAGSTAGLEHTDLLIGGGAAIAVGGAVLAIGWRRRRAVS